MGAWGQAWILIPFFILLVVRGLQIISQGKGTTIYVIFTLCLLTPPLNSLQANFFHPIRREEVRPLLTYLHSHRKPSDHVYIYYGASHAVKYYRRDEASETAFFHYGTSSRNDRSKYIDDINTMKKWPRVWSSRSTNTLSE